MAEEQAAAAAAVGKLKEDEEAKEDEKEEDNKAAEDQKPAAIEVEYHANGALVVVDVKCKGACGFMGGYSGYCSQCWGQKSSSEQAQATADILQMVQERAAKKAKRDPSIKYHTGEFHDAVDSRYSTTFTTRQGCRGECPEQGYYSNLCYGCWNKLTAAKQKTQSNAAKKKLKGAGEAIKMCTFEKKAVQTTGYCDNGCFVEGEYSLYCAKCFKTKSEEERDELAKVAEQVLREERDKDAKKRKAEAEATEEADRQYKTARQQAIAKSPCQLLLPRCSRVNNNNNNGNANLEDKLGWGMSLKDYDAKSEPAFEYWTCGLVNPDCSFGHGEPHVHADMDYINRMHELVLSLRDDLDGAHEPSSEGYSQWVGFYINVCDNPSLSARSTTNALLRKVFPLHPKHIKFQKVTLANDDSNLVDLFPRGDDREEDREKYETAAQKIVAACKPGTFFHMYPGGNADFYSGPVFCGGRTEQGDIVGCRTEVVWT